MNFTSRKGVEHEMHGSYALTSISSLRSISFLGSSKIEGTIASMSFSIFSRFCAVGIMQFADLIIPLSSIPYSWYSDPRGASTTPTPVPSCGAIVGNPPFPSLLNGEEERLASRTSNIFRESYTECTHSTTCAMLLVMGFEQC